MPEYLNEIDSAGKARSGSHLEASSQGLIYEAQDGQVYHPKYRVVPFSRKLRHQDFNFTERQGTYVQTLGWESGVVQVEVYFVGADHHEQARAFERSLTIYARGVAGKLYLPLDTIDRWRTVIPVEYTRRVDYVEAANRTVYQIVFKESIPLAEPAVEKVRTSYAAVISDASNEDLNSLSQNEGVIKNLRGAAQNIKNRVLGEGSFVRKAGKWVRGSTSYQNLSTIAKDLGSTLDYISINAQTLVRTPYQLSSLIDRSMQRVFGANIPQSVYVLGGVLDQLKDIDNTVLREVKGNSWVRLLFGAPLVSSMAKYSAAYNYLSRTEALTNTEAVLEAYEGFVAFIHDQEDVTAEQPMARRFVADPGIMDFLQSSIRDFTAAMNLRLGTLRQEVTVEVAEPTTLLNIVAQYYPTLFKKDPNTAMSLFEQTNSLTSDKYELFDVGDSYTILV